MEEHQQRRRLRHRQSTPALGSAPPAVAHHAKPSFRIGGKMDPGRFVSQHQQHFLILGFHDDERSDRVIVEEDGGDPTGGGDRDNVSAPLLSCHPLRLNFGRNTLSPVREHQDGGGGSNDIVALMQQTVM